MGRAKTPIAKAILTGRVRQDGVQVNAEGYPINMNQPSTGVQFVANDIPELLLSDDIAAKEWTRIINIFNRVDGWVEVSDFNVVIAYCRSFSRWVRVYADYDKALLKVSKDPIKRMDFYNKSFRAIASAEKDMLKCAGEIGLTPSSRGKINTGQQKSGGLSKKEQFERKHGGTA